jgi:uncharacterized SAM-binding protein YcdF (DUF218 family)
MFFYLSKIFWFFADPGNILVFLLVVSGYLVWTRRYWLMRGVVAFTMLYALVLAVVPIGRQMIVALENRFPAAAVLPGRVGGVIVLGGIVDGNVTEARQQPAVGGAVERLTAFAALAREYSDVPLIFTGGSGSLTDQATKEADFAGAFFDQLGVDSARLIYENQSRNTYENARNSKGIAGDVTTLPWVLVTSALHMPRAVGVFREAGWNVIPYPVDYVTTGEEGWALRFDLAAGIGDLRRGLHEFLGLAVYRLTGRTDALYPSADDATRAN